MLRTSVAFLLWIHLSCFAASPNVAFFYGANPPWDELRAYDIVVVEPGHGIDPKVVSMPGTQVFAYLSVGEIEYDRPYAKAIPKGIVGGANEPWKAHVVDQTHPEWPRFFLDQVVAPLWKAGYRGFFLDTLDSFQIIAKTDEERARQAKGLAGVIRTLRKQYPEAKLIFNRGFEILPELHGDAYAVAVESIYRGWDQRSGRYVEVSEADRNWLMPHLVRVSKEYKLPVIAIEYAPPGETQLARETARRVADLGFVPWVANSDLSQLGVGNLEVMPRRILMVYQGTGNPYALMDHRVHRLATMPLNHLGYMVEYVDITNQPLPDVAATGRYAGIVTWFNPGETRQPAVRQWLARQRDQGVKIAMLGAFPFDIGEPLAKSFGLTAPGAARPAERFTITERHGIIGFEAQPVPDRRAFLAVQSAGSAALLRVTSDAGDVMDAAAITPWGGYVLAPFDYLELPLGQGDRWIVQPIEFFKAALRLPDMPVPDVTTENGRRLMLVHIDGDGFMNRAEFRGTPYAGEVLLRDILERFRIPTTMSVIQGELAANGLFPKDSPALEAIARRIFALPHVEIASHTYSHPFRWAELATGADAERYNLNIPGYRFSLETEIDGSVRYIDERLAPSGKRTRLVQWTGDTNPGPEALERVYRLGLLNLNGGDTTITRAHPTLTRVAPIGLQKGPYFQVYAPNQNENVYTNNWTGPFYGYERAIETFQLTDQPAYRLKPINIYYHSYSATRRASMSALERVYTWALSQPVMNIYASEYAQKVHDFNRTVIARGPDGWIVRTGESLRQLRVPASLGTPDLAASRGVSGFQGRGTERYVHLAGGEAVIRFDARPPTQAYVVDANGRIERFERKGRSAQFALRGHTPLRFTLANTSGCRVEGDGRPLSGVTAGGITRYELKQNAIERISITCAQSS